MATSRVPAAVDALLAILRSAAGSDVTVIDGPPVGNVLGDQVYVGWQPDEDGAVTLQQDFNSAGARTRDENFAIQCYAESRTGDREMQPRRARVFELLATVEEALRATEAAPTAPTLNGTVLWAHLTIGNLRQLQADGVLAGVSFTISCRARI
ncbi:hypothetical protein ACFWCA_32860 [Streptomyces phaeochromogenes]|uniref:hypothetical protein n=1 Tax=Streptomyces phaeochromogenes TaxID=1923 RepID=UPI0036C4CD4D